MFNISQVTKSKSLSWSCKSLDLCRFLRHWSERLKVICSVRVLQRLKRPCFRVISISSEREKWQITIKTETLLLERDELSSSLDRSALGEREYIAPNGPAVRWSLGTRRGWNERRLFWRKNISARVSPNDEGHLALRSLTDPRNKKIKNAPHASHRHQ